MKRLKLIKNKNPDELAREVNDFLSKHKTTASPIIYAKSTFYCFIYYEDDGKLYNEKPSKKPLIKRAFSGNFKDPDGPVTPKQEKTLKKLGYKGEARLLTTKGASDIIAVLIKERKSKK